MPEARTSGRTAFMTVKEVAEELEMTTSGVHKLIQRGKLKAVRKSERKRLVPRPALHAYRARLEGRGPSVEMPRVTRSAAEVRAQFEATAGLTPEAWIGAWKADQLEDSIENMNRMIEALSIITADEGDEPSSIPAQPASALSAGP